jgi:hypothetical protein
MLLLLTSVLGTSGKNLVNLKKKNRPFEFAGWVQV